MSRYSLSQLTDGRLLSELPRIAATDRATTADLLAHLAEAEVRRLYAVAGCSSMLEYCTKKLLYSDDAAQKRITASRVARDYPVLFDMVADGRMSVSTILMVGAKLPTPDAESLIEECAGRSRSEIEWLLAKRFPRPGSFEWGTSAAAANADSGNTSAPGRMDSANPPMNPAIPSQPKPDAKLTPLDEDRVALQVTITRAIQRKLERAKELLGYEVAQGDAAALLDRALDSLIVELEKKKYGKHTKHRAAAAKSEDPRYIPGAVREQVAVRDGEQCTFVADDGARCECRTALEVDHIVPVAQGGEPTPDNLRLLCRAHNQLEAERRMGREFMASKRSSRAGEKAETKPVLKFPYEDDLRAALSSLKCTAAEVSIGLCASATLPPEATCEQRMRAALAALRPPKAQKQSFAPAPSPPQPV